MLLTFMIQSMSTVDCDIVMWESSSEIYPITIQISRKIIPVKVNRSKVKLVQNHVELLYLPPTMTESYSYASMLFLFNQRNLLTPSPPFYTHTHNMKLVQCKIPHPKTNLRQIIAY